MKNLSFTIALLLFSCLIYCQSTLDEKIIGSWKVTRIVKSSAQPELQDMNQGFAGSTFSFAADHTFTVTTKNNSEMFRQFTKMVIGKKWITKYNSVIAIGSKADNYSIMNIIYRLEDDVVTFVLDESGVVLEVEKEQ